MKYIKLKYNDNDFDILVVYDYDYFNTLKIIRYVFEVYKENRTTEILSRLDQEGINYRYFTPSSFDQEFNMGA